MYKLEDTMLEERDPDLDEEDDTKMVYSREGHWRDVYKDYESMSKIHSLWWYVYTKYKKELIKREFLVSFPHLKGGKMFWTCVKDNVIKEKEYSKAIGTRRFDYK